MNKNPVADKSAAPGEAKSAKREADNNNPAVEAKRPAEIGGRDGPEPTRFGDWEKNGRCIDF